MLRSLVVFYALNVLIVSSALKPIYTGSLYVPTFGEVWPKPQKQIKLKDLYTYDPQIFKVTITRQSCAMLVNAINRCVMNLNSLHHLVKKYGTKLESDVSDVRREQVMKHGKKSESDADNVRGEQVMKHGKKSESDADNVRGEQVMKHVKKSESDADNARGEQVMKHDKKSESDADNARGEQVMKHDKKSERDADKDSIDPIIKLRVDLTSECEEYPHLGMEEAYNLEVSSVSILRSTTIWGIIRGLETFSQLFFINPNYTDVCAYETEIFDYPRYTHRGLLIDTSRHFLSLTTILMTIKALAMNKMNVLHWHMTDDQSFPYQSEIFPALSHRGAFHSSMVYTKDDIQKVITYARDRGIRVIPEFGVPSHTLSWGIAFPYAIAECYNENQQQLGQGTMNPIEEVTYRLMRYLFTEVQEVFKDKYFHLGGDEVNFACWESNPAINKFMKDNDMQSSDLLAMFFKKTFSLFKNTTSFIVWQDVFEEHVPLNFDTLVQVWKGDGDAMLKPIQEGYYVLYSSKWFLDLHDTFIDFYMRDPRKMVTDITNKPWDAKYVLGGEACIWGENVDDRNLFSRAWPRTCAVAERLWSSADEGNNVEVEVLYRLEEHVCRMNRRGIPIQPVGPGFCVI